MAAGRPADSQGAGRPAASLRRPVPSGRQLPTSGADARSPDERFVFLPTAFIQSSISLKTAVDMGGIWGNVERKIGSLGRAVCDVCASPEVHHSEHATVAQ